MYSAVICSIIIHVLFALKASTDTLENVNNFKVSRIIRLIDEEQLISVSPTLSIHAIYSQGHNENYSTVVSILSDNKNAIHIASSVR